MRSTHPAAASSLVCVPPKPHLLMNGGLTDWHEDSTSMLLRHRWSRRSARQSRPAPPERAIRHAGALVQATLSYPEVSASLRRDQTIAWNTCRRQSRIADNVHMKAIELVGAIDKRHRLCAEVPPELPAGQVRLIVLLPEGDTAGTLRANGFAKRMVGGPGRHSTGHLYVRRRAAPECFPVRFTSRGFLSAMFPG